MQRGLRCAGRPGQLVPGFVLREHAVGCVLGLLHVGLVEGVDLKAPAGDRDGDLREQEHAAEVIRAAGGDRDHGMARLGECRACANRQPGSGVKMSGR